MLSDERKAAASSVIFLISSLGLAVTGPNTLVISGGIAASLAATICLFANQIQSIGTRYERLIPFLGLCANVPLTINGIFMVQGGMASGQNALTIAGTCLTLANAVFYGNANFRACFNWISVVNHARFSMGAGAMIAASGVASHAPALTMIGCGYLTEAALRRHLASQLVVCPQELQATFADRQCAPKI